MFTICYFDTTDNRWIGHRRFRDLATAIDVCERRPGTPGPHMVVGNGGRILHGSPIFQNPPKGW